MPQVTTAPGGEVLEQPIGEPRRARARARGARRATTTSSRGSSATARMPGCKDSPTTQYSSPARGPDAATSSAYPRVRRQVGNAGPAAGRGSSCRGWRKRLTRPRPLGYRLGARAATGRGARTEWSDVYLDVEREAVRPASGGSRRRGGWRQTKSASNSLIDVVDLDRDQNWARLRPSGAAKIAWSIDDLLVPFGPTKSMIGWSSGRVRPSSSDLYIWNRTSSMYGRNPSLFLNFDSILPVFR